MALGACGHEQDVCRGGGEHKLQTKGAQQRFVCVAWL